MNRLNFLIEWYHKENERTRALENALSIPVGILTGIFAVLFFMFKDFNFESEKSQFIEYLFLIFLSITSILWIVVIFYLFKSYNKVYSGFGYAGIPFPSELNDHYKNLEDYYEKDRENLDQNTTVDSMFEEDLRQLLSKSLDVRISNNIVKSNSLYKAKQFLLFCIISLVLCGVLFSINLYETKISQMKSEIDRKNAIINQIF